MEEETIPKEDTPVAAPSWFPGMGPGLTVEEKAQQRSIELRMMRVQEIGIMANAIAAHSKYGAVDTNGQYDGYSGDAEKLAKKLVELIELI